VKEYGWWLLLLGNEKDVELVVISRLATGCFYEKVVNECYGLIHIY
jgi:hypothetical protein